jgi:hypothetical protein
VRDARREGEIAALLAFASVALTLGRVAGLGEHGTAAGGTGMQARMECQLMNAVIRIETSSPGSSTPSLAT